MITAKKPEMRTVQTPEIRTVKNPQTRTAQTTDVFFMQRAAHIVGTATEGPSSTNFGQSESDSGQDTSNSDAESARVSTGRVRGTKSKAGIRMINRHSPSQNDARVPQQERAPENEMRWKQSQ